MAKNKQNNALLDVKFFSEKGFNRINLSVILRDEIDSFRFYSNDGKIEFPPRFSSFEPLGNPPSFFSGMGHDNDTVYVSVFATENIACNLTLTTEMTNDFEHPLLFLPDLKVAMGNLLANFSENKDGKLIISGQGEHLSYDLLSLSDFSSVLYSILSRQKVLVVGELFQILNFFKTVISLIPKKYQKWYGYTINLPPLADDEIVFYGITPQLMKKFQSAIEKLTSSQEALDIVNLIEEKCFTNYEVKYLKELISSLESSDSSEVVSVIQEQFEKLAHLASQVSFQEDISVVSEKLGVDYDLADLLVAMAKRLIQRRNK